MTTLRDEEPGSHGTAAASVAVGKNVGVAKNAQFIGVKFDSNATDANPDDLTECWSWIVDDVIAKNRKGKAIISMSYGEHSFFTQCSLAHFCLRFSRLPLLQMD